MRQDKNTQHHAMLIYFEPPTTNGPDSAQAHVHDAPRHVSVHTPTQYVSVKMFP